MGNVGIITYINSPNYGASLQLYATYCAIKKIGFDPIIVNYTNEYENNSILPLYLLKKGKIKDFIRILIAGYLFKSVKIGKKNFELFYKDMTISNKIHGIKDLANLPIDVFCVGSDQVWNPRITGGYDNVFFVNDFNIKRKVSFSSSMGSSFDKFNDCFIKEALSNFQSISVRETDAQKYLNGIGIQNVYKAVDPTLLFDKTGWMNLCKKSNYKIPSDYLLIYAIGGEFNKLLNIAKPIAEKLKLKIAAITLSTRKKKIDYIINDATPIDFPPLFRGANFVVTNSFHGTCFSIINEIPFISVKYEANPGRAVSLLEDCNLLSRLYSYNEPNSNIDILCDVSDIKTANGLLAKRAEESFIWLEKAIRNAKEKDNDEK